MNLIIELGLVAPSELFIGLCGLNICVTPLLATIATGRNRIRLCTPRNSYVLFIRIAPNTHGRPWMEEHDQGARCKTCINKQALEERDESHIKTVCSPMHVG